MAVERPPVALVTGSAGEIGDHLVRHLLARGWIVLGVDRRERQSGAPDALVFRRCDLEDANEAETVLGELAALHGCADVLVNCAGRIASAPLVTRTSGGWTAHDFGLWRDVLGGCLTTAFHASVITARNMLAARRRGVIINISSVCARGNAGQAAYSAAKAGLDGLTRAMAKELGPLGIRAVGLAPGYFDTRSTRDALSPEKLARVAGAVPLKRLGALPDLARAIDFVIDNPYVNGTIVEVDGGLVL